VLLANELDIQNLTQSQRLLDGLEVDLYENYDVERYQNHFITLLALSECIKEDKVQQLPLLLKTINDGMKPAFLRSYSSFMKDCREKGHFNQDSSGILQEQLIEAVRSTDILHDNNLVEYVASLGSKPTNQCEFMKQFDPCRIQAMSAFLR
jgi:hypothetical protein